MMISKAKKIIWKTAQQRVDDSWEEVQTRYADLPGAEGVEQRRLRYRPFFLRMGRDVVIHEGCRFYHPDRIVLEDDVRINIGALIYGSGGIRIGRHARIGPRFFVHSANHDVADAPTAFFERGYDYHPTVIGDNVLISANVSVMPGAVIGNSTFVAAGAVVPSGRYEERARLFGVPARQTLPGASDGAVDAPEMAFLVPENGEFRDAVLHLLSALGLPQVSVFVEGEPLPASLHSVILCGPADWNPGLPDGPEVWRLAGGDRVLPEDAACFAAPSGERIALPVRVETSVVPDGREGEDRWIRAVEQTLYWLTTRLAKGAGPLSADEAGEWQAAFRILGVDHGRGDRLRERIEEMIARRGTNGSPGKRTTLVLTALDSGHDAGALADQVEWLSSAARSAADLIAACVAAELIGEDAIGGRIREMLDSPEWREPGIAMPHSAAGSKGFCYSPLVLPWLFLEARRDNPDFRIPEGLGAPRRISRSLEWRQVSASGALLDDESRTISRSLLDNWIAMHEAPCPDGCQVVLEDFNYAQRTEPLERAWREVFLHFQGRKGRPWSACVRGRPERRPRSRFAMTSTVRSATAGLPKSSGGR